MAEEGHKVVLHVYDLSQGLAQQLSSSFLGKAIEGIWHTGVVVFGNEYYFGGGIQSCPDGQTPYGKPYKKLELGCTQVPREVFEDYLQEISPRYTTETYSLLQHNCNNFSEEISQFLLGTSIPDFILKLPEEIMSSPMGALITPMIQQFETILRHGGVPQVPHGGSPLGMPDFRHVHTSNVTRSPASNGASDVSSSFKSEGISGVDSTANGSNSVFPPTHTGTDAAAKTEVKNGTVGANATGKDKLGEARARVQEEITNEFGALMAEGRLRASEAAALATRRVMERHGRGSGLSPQS